MAILLLPHAAIALAAAAEADRSGHVKWFQTAQFTEDRISEQSALFFDFSTRLGEESSIDVRIDTTETYQQILGFGGALTQSSAWVYRLLPTNLQQEIVEAYYGPTGIGYSTGRLPIHSCDFSVDVYTFDDAAGDANLDNFDSYVTYDQNLSLPLIKDVLKVKPDLTLFGSPWSPPAWMKDNNNMMYGGSLLEEYAHTWASYFSKWITAYSEQGVNIWGVTVQNEPEATQTWESCIYNPQQTRDFVAEHLGPVLAQDHPEVKILGFDHNKDHIVDWADTLLAEDSPSAPYMDGIAFHWYSGSCFDNVKKVSDTYPEAILLPSEACYELTVLSDDASEETWLANGTWTKGEGYGYDIMGDLLSGSAGWTDWNIVLDQNGGPNHVNNFCDAAIIADVSNEQDQESMAIYFHPQYYYMGHFSKFLLPGAQRVGSTVSGVVDNQSKCAWPYGECDATTLHVSAWDVSTSSFSSSGDGGGNNHIAVVVMNCGDEDKEMALHVNEFEGKLYNTVPAHSIQTYLIPKQVEQ